MLAFLTIISPPGSSEIVDIIPIISSKDKLVEVVKQVILDYSYTDNSKYQYAVISKKE